MSESLVRRYEMRCNMDNGYNVLEVINDLIACGYDEERAEEVAMLNNYNIPLEDMYDYE